MSVIYGSPLSSTRVMISVEEYMILTRYQTDIQCRKRVKQKLPTKKGYHLATIFLKKEMSLFLTHFNYF